MIKEAHQQRSKDISLWLDKKISEDLTKGSTKRFTNEMKHRQH
jgi:hypothetical protein